MTDGPRHPARPRHLDSRLKLSGMTDGPVILSTLVILTEGKNLPRRGSEQASVYTRK